MLVGSALSSEAEPTWSYQTGASVRAYRPGSATQDLLAEDDVVLPLRKAAGGAFAGTILIGRASSNDVQVEDPSISKLHARFVLGEALELRDAESTNGTFVNEKRVSGDPTPVRHGDEICFGERTFVLYGTGLFYELLRARPFRTLD